MMSEVLFSRNVYDNEYSTNSERVCEKWNIEQQTEPESYSLH